jgi:hypothetical protein
MTLVTKQQVRSMIQGSNAPVKKYVDTNFSFSPSTSTYSNLTVLNMPTAGTGASNCSGDAIKILKFEVHSASNVISSGTYDTVGIRSFLVQNSQPSSSALTVSDLFDNTSGIAVLTSPLSYSEKGTVYKLCSSEHLYCMSTVWNSFHLYKYACKPKIPNCRYGTVWETGTPVLVHCFNNTQVNSEINVYGYVRMWFEDV